MNLENVVLVRAMNNLPLNGELIPSCEGERLVNDHQSEFYYFMRNCITRELEQQLGRSLELYIDSEDAQLLDNKMNDYNVLTGDYYTTTLSFALNGMVPDDMNNNFTDMKLAVLEPLKNQTGADFVTIETIDTTVKGRMKTSSEAILVIEQTFFKELSEAEQVNLISNYKVKLFDGELRQAVNDTLKENNYPVLPLVQSREKKNIDECPEKDSMLSFEDQFSVMVGASRQRLQYLTFMYNGGTEIDEIAHNKISEEHNNTLIVKDHYKKELYNFMLNKAEQFGIDVTDEERYYLFTNYEAGEDAMKRISTSLINAYGGIENFKGFVQEYNQHIKDNYLTNQQIVSLTNEKTI